jgi:hypothetical protein
MVSTLLLLSFVACGDSGPDVVGEWITDDGDSLAFGEDGSLVVYGEEGSYTLDGTELTLSDPTGETRVFEVVMDGEAMSLQEADGYVWMRMYPKRFLTRSQLLGDWAQDPDSFSARQFTFNDDDTFVYEDNWSDEQGTWELAETGELTLDYGWGDTETVQPVAMNDLMFLIDADMYAGNPFSRVEPVVSTNSTSQVQEASTNDWDEILDTYEAYIDILVDANAKYQDDPNDMSALTDLQDATTQLLTLTDQLENARGDMTTAQAQRFSNIAMDAAEAMSP